MSRRWLIRYVFMLPLLLCVVGWAWSGTHVGWVRCIRGGHWLECYTASGAIFVDTGWGNPAANGWLCGIRVTPAVSFWPGSKLPFASFLGFSLNYGAWEGQHYFRCGVPYWILISLFALALFFFWRNPKQKKPGGAFPVEVNRRA